MKSLNAFGMSVDVVFSDHITEYGHWDSDQSRLTLSTRYPLLVQQLTAGHELVHIIEDHFKLDLTEDQVDTIGRGLVLLVRSNPKLVEFLTR